MASVTQVWNRRVLGEVVEAAVVGTATAAWVAVAGLPGMQRRLSRALIAAAAYAVPRSDPDQGVADAAAAPWERGSPSTPDAAEPTGPVWRRVGVVVVAGVGVAAVSRVLVAGVERRWLQSLAVTHRHPRLALAVRVGVLAFLATSSPRLLDRTRPAAVVRPAPTVAGGI